jgi:large subunit ribosomal protein L30
MAKKSSETIFVRWVRSGIGFSYHQKRMVRSLGLRRLNQTVELQDTPSNRGLVARIPHLVEIVRPETRPSGTPVPEFSIHAAEASPVSTPKPAQREEIEEAAGPAAPETSAETAEGKE